MSRNKQSCSSHINKCQIYSPLKKTSSMTTTYFSTLTIGKLGHKHNDNHPENIKTKRGESLKFPSILPHLTLTSDILYCLES